MAQYNAQFEKVKHFSPHLASDPHHLLVFQVVLYIFLFPFFMKRGPNNYLDEWKTISFVAPHVTIMIPLFIDFFKI